MTSRTAPPRHSEAAGHEGNGPGDLAARYGCGPVKFTGADDALYDRRLVFDHVVAPEDAGTREQFEAVADAIRDVLSQRWVRTQREYDQVNPKQVYYLAMEFLIGRSLANNVANLMLSGSRGWYDPRWHYEHEDETRQALNLIFSGHFSRGEPGLFDPIRDALLGQGDYYMHLAALASYVTAQSRVSALYADRREWGRKAVLNVARSGKFSSDRTITEYAESIWGASPCPVD